MKKLVLLILILFPKLSYTQSFYVNTLDSFANSVYEFDVSDNREVLQNNCSLGQIPDDFFTDMAIDKDSNTYYLSLTGDLYIKELNGSCRFLGRFPITGFVNALIADNNNFLYASGTEYIDGVEIGALYKYDLTTGIFSTVGMLPLNFIPAGDLFFYNRKLFLASQNTVSLTSCILEIDMIDPLQSRFYMESEDEIYGAFSINYGSYSKAYVISVDIIGSYLYELDMENRQPGRLIRTYNYTIYGATAWYDLTSTNATPNLPTVSLGEDITTCIGKETTLEAKVLPVSFSYTFKWSTGETSSQINIKDAGIYWVDVTSRYGIIRDSIEVKQQKCDLDIFTSNPLGEVINACTAEELILEIKLPSLLTSYPVKWSTGEVNTQINVQDAGIYWAELVSPYGVFRDSIEIKEEKCIFIPNVFTPNHDGVNETFYIKGIKKGNWQLKIYDRKGLLVYEDNAYKNNWKGDGLPVALYYYQLINEENTENYKGWVQIMK